MTLQQRLTGFINAVGADIKSLITNQGTLANLTTTDKTNLVGAINEVKNSAGVQINDTTASGSSTYSSTKINAQIQAAKDELRGGASSAMDTFAELQAEMEADDTASAGLVTAIGLRPTYTETGNLDADLLAAYNTAKA